MEELVVAGRHAEEAYEERERHAVGHAEVVEEVGAAGQEGLEEVERRAHRPGEPVDDRRPAAASSASAITFGGRFQTRLNQSTKTSTSARRAGSAGKSGGSGKRALRWRGWPSSRGRLVAVDQHRHERRPLTARPASGRPRRRRSTRSRAPCTRPRARRARRSSRTGSGRREAPRRDRTRCGSVHQDVTGCSPDRRQLMFARPVQGYGRLHANPKFEKGSFHGEEA